MKKAIRTLLSAAGLQRVAPRPQRPLHVGATVFMSAIGLLLPLLVMPKVWPAERPARAELVENPFHLPGAAKRMALRAAAGGRPTLGLGLQTDYWTLASTVRAEKKALTLLNGRGAAANRTPAAAPLPGAIRLPAAGLPPMQQTFQSGTISASDAGACTTANACVVVKLTQVQQVNPSPSYVGVSVAGNGGGNTLQFETSVDGVNFSAANATPPNSSTPVTTTTGNGTWVVFVGSMAIFRVRCSTFVSGTVTVNTSTSNAIATASLTGSSSGGSGVPASGTFPYTGTSNVIFDLQLNAGAGNPLADSSGNGLGFTIGTCSVGSVAWGAAPQFGLTFTQGRNCITSNSAIPTTLHAIEVAYCAGPFGNMPVAGAAAPSYNEMLYGSTSLEGPFMGLSDPSGAGRQPEHVTESTFAPASSVGSASNGIGCHMNTFVLDATNDVFYQDNIQLRDFESAVPFPAQGHSFPLNASYTMVLGGSDATGALGNPGNLDATVYSIRGLAVEPTPGINGTQAGEYAAMQFRMAQRGIVLGSNGTVFSSPSNTNLLNRAFTVGDSLLNGTSLNAGAQNFYSALGGWDYTNNAIVSTYASGANFNCQSDLVPNINPFVLNVPVIGWGHNDMSIGLSAQQTVSHVLRIVQCAHNNGVPIPVMVDYMSTAGLSGQLDLTREVANDILRQVAPSQGFVLADIGSDTRIGIQGGFNNTTYFQVGDHVHPTLAGLQIQATIIGRNITRAAALNRPATTPNTFKVGNAVPTTVENFTFCNNASTLPTLCAGTNTVPTITYNQPINPGDAPCVISGETNGTLNSIADTAGGTWASQVGVTWIGVRTELWCAPNSTGANSDTATVTFSTTQGNLLRLTGLAFRGAATSNIIDVSTTSSGNNSTPTTGTITTTAANEVVCAILATSVGYPSLSITPGYDMLTNEVPTGGGSNFMQCTFVPVSGTVVSSTSSTLSPSGSWGLLFFALKPGVFPATWALRETDGINSKQPQNIDASGGAATLQLSDAVGIVGQHVYLRNSVASGNVITLAPKIGSGETLNGVSSMVLPNLSDADCFSVFSGNITAGANYGCTITQIAPTASPSNTIVFTADWTCGTGGTVASCVAATILGSTVTPMTFTLPAQALSWDLDCDGVVSSATGTPANNWNLLTATNGATNTTASYSMGTAAAVGGFGATTDQASTTTTFSIGGTWTLGAAATKFPFHIHARIEGASASGTVLSLQVVDPTVADLLTIYRGTTCRVRSASY